MDGVDTQVIFHGQEQLVSLFRDLPEKVRRNAMRNATRKGATLVLARARAAAPKDTGDLAKSLRLKEIDGRRTGVVGWRVFAPTIVSFRSKANKRGETRWLKGRGLRSGERYYYDSKANQSIGKVRTLKTGKEKSARKKYYAIHIERGWKHFKARPFMRPALEQSKGEAFQMMNDALYEELTKAVAASGLQGVKVTK